MTFTKPWLRHPRIALDIDGVIANFQDAWIKVLARHGVTVKLPWDNYEMSYKGQAIFNKIAQEEGFHDIFLGLDPIRPLNRLNWEPECYITARDPSLMEVTKQWIEANRLPAKPVISASTPYDKAIAALDMKIEVYVDDRFDIFKEMHSQGIDCYLMDQPYNRKFHVDPWRIYSLDELNY